MAVDQGKECTHIWQSLCCNAYEQAHIPFVCPKCFGTSTMKCFECYTYRERPKVQRLTHLVIRVRDVQRSKRFYTDIMGLEVTASFPGMVFYAAEETSTTHDLATMEIGSTAPGPEDTRVGLYHMAWQVDSIHSLEEFHRHLKAQGVKIVGYGEHGVGFGIYFLDPDGNEIEVVYEQPKELWPGGKPVLRGAIPFEVNLE